MAETSGEIPINSETPNNPSQQTSGVEIVEGEGASAPLKIVDMVQDPDDKWTTRTPEDPNFFYEPGSENPTVSDVKPQTEPVSQGPPKDFWAQWQAGESQRNAQYQQFNQEANVAWANFQQTGRFTPDATPQSSFPKPENKKENSQYTVKNETVNLEARAITDRLNTIDHTGSALNAFVHEQVRFSSYSEMMANFIRFRGCVGERVILGTNHESTAKEIELVDSFIEDIKKQKIGTAYVESGGLSTNDNLDKWLAEKGYIPDESRTGELAYLTNKLYEKGIKVINMDLAHNPSALPYALEKFGLERTARAINWDLNLRSMRLDTDKPALDKDKIPEIVTSLINQSGLQVNQEQIGSIIRGRDIMDDDYFTDKEREEYMVTIISEEKSAIAAHTAHSAALLEKMPDAPQDMNFYVDSDKINRVLAEKQK